MIQKIRKVLLEILLLILPAIICSGQATKVFDIDYQSLISKADLDYDVPATRSEEGMPIGNGTMGSLVWTTPTALKLQVNRVDVFATNRDTKSFPERDTDYGSSCAYLDIDFVDFGDEIFSGTGFNQHLSVYDALQTIKGKGITAKALAWNKEDVFAIEIDDQRTEQSATKIDLRMLRHVVQFDMNESYNLVKNHIVRVRNRSQVAESQLHIVDGKILLTQVYTEGNYYNSTAVAVEIVGRKSMAKYANDAMVRLTAAPGKGKYTVLVSSASSFDKNVNIVNLALDKLKTAKAFSFDNLLDSNKEWWHNFWSKSCVHLQSKDGIAQYVEQSYHYLLYLMGSTSRGLYPPRFGGMLWFTNGDMRMWGEQQWWHNLSCYYCPLSQANHQELLQPLFKMYSGMYPACETYARQVFGSKGIVIPETVFFDGPPELSEDIAKETAELFLNQKPWSEASAAFLEYADTRSPHQPPFNYKARGNWVDGKYVYEYKKGAPFSDVNHLIHNGLKIAYLYWLKYESDLDTCFLKEYAYPILKGAVEFYRNFPNTKKGDDGKYHIYFTNSGEGQRGVKDSEEDIAGLRGIVPLAIKSSEILKTDPELRAQWKEFLDNLPPLPESVNSAFFYDNISCLHKGTDDFQRVVGAYDKAFANADLKNRPFSVLDRTATAAANLGRGDDLKYMIYNQLRSLAPQNDFCAFESSGAVGVLRNRMTLREGPGALGAQRIGRIAFALQQGLMQSMPKKAGESPVINVFPACPSDWDVQFTLLARNAFLVSSSMKSGNIEFVEIKSLKGQECQMINPWGEKKVRILRGNGSSFDASGPVLKFPTKPEECIVIQPKDQTKKNLTIKIPQL